MINGLGKESKAVKEKVVDPVCGMNIDKDEALGTSDYEGRVYYFCAACCQRRFEANPEQYADGDRSVTPAQA